MSSSIHVFHKLISGAVATSGGSLQPSLRGSRPPVCPRLRGRCPPGPTASPKPITNPERNKQGDYTQTLCGMVSSIRVDRSSGTSSGYIVATTKLCFLRTKTLLTLLMWSSRGRPKSACTTCKGHKVLFLPCANSESVMMNECHHRYAAQANAQSANDVQDCAGTVSTHLQHPLLTRCALSRIRGPPMDAQYPLITLYRRGDTRITAMQTVASRTRRRYFQCAKTVLISASQNL